MKIFFKIIFLSIFLFSCSNKEYYKIDSESLVAKSKNSRIKFIILHYTAGNDSSSIHELTNGNVSSHYLILSKDNKKIYNLVLDNERAWHAGVSSFRSRTNLNDTSIGIEIVNEGIKKEFRNYEDYHPYEHYADYKENQIKKVAFLLKKLIATYGIPARNIIAHSDIAPSRKTDPGAKFPWEILYKNYNIGAWYNDEDKIFFMSDESYLEYLKLTVKDIKKELRVYGYSINNTDEWDEESRDVVYAFQLHFNSQNLSGEMDFETYAILRALNKKYVHKN